MDPFDHPWYEEKKMSIEDHLMREMQKSGFFIDVEPMKQMTITVDVPGASRENVAVELDTQTLHIKWNHPLGTRTKEIMFTPTNVDRDTAVVSVCDGILTLVVQLKPKPSTRKKLEIR